MTGKEKCNLLRQIRKEIAESNSIVYLTSDCSFQGDCKGTCPKCDAEVRYLDSEIQRLAREGKAISLSRLSLNTLENAISDSSNSSAHQPMKWFEEPLSTSGAIESIDADTDDFDFIPDVMGMIKSVEWPDNHEQSILKMAIEEIDLGSRITNVLTRHGIKTVSDLLSVTDDDLRYKMHLSIKHITEIDNRLMSLCELKRNGK